MAFTPILQGVKVEEIFTFDSAADAALVWGVWINAVSLDSGLATEINNAFNSFHSTVTSGLSLNSARSNKSTLTERIITDVRTATGPQFTFFPNVTGGNAGDPLPTGTALVLRLFSGTRGRSYRGRKYFPGLTEGNNTSDAKPDSGIISVAVGGLTALIAAVNANTSDECELAVLSRVLGQAEKVISGSIDSTWHYQRRRAR
jgi:hypothetical protein